jgi:hypothetical protein
LVNNAAEIKNLMAERAAHYHRELTFQFDSLFPQELDWRKVASAIIRSGARQCSSASR